MDIPDIITEIKLTNLGGPLKWKVEFNGQPQDKIRDIVVHIGIDVIPTIIIEKVIG